MDGQPNVVGKEAAEFIRARVFRLRAVDVISPREIVPQLVSAGLGEDFPDELRMRRLKTWVLQVLRRLNRQDWLDRRNDRVWMPTAALKSCSDQALLAKRAPKDSVVPPPVPPTSWEKFIQSWVFSHRAAKFATDDLVVAIVQQGYAAGEPEDGLERARALVSRELAGLEKECLLEGDGEAGEWQPTDLLKSWRDR